MPDPMTPEGRPRLLDLFCCAGGAAKGYQRAGFYVVGVDIEPQPNYCGDEFYQADAIEWMDAMLDDPSFIAPFKAIHASPVCHDWSPLASVTGANGTAHLLIGTLERLRMQSRPWVVENVPGADMPGATVLCGSMFGLRVRRHRLFLSNVAITAPPCDHARQGPVVGVYGTGGPDSGRAARGGGGGVKVAGAEAAAALGIEWTTRQQGLSQAIPPAYTEHIGRQLLAHLESEAAA